MQCLRVNGCGISEKLRDDRSDRNASKAQVSACRIQSDDGRSHSYREPPRRVGIDQVVLRRNKNEHFRFHAQSQLVQGNAQFYRKVKSNNGLPLADLIAGRTRTALGVFLDAIDKRVKPLEFVCDTR